MSKTYLLGLDVGSSSVKASIVEVASGRCVASAFYPKQEAPIKALKTGWAEQAPSMWWENAKLAIADTMSACICFSIVYLVLDSSTSFGMTFFVRNDIICIFRIPALRCLR